MKNSVVLIFGLFACANSNAWDSQPIGKVERIEINSPSSSKRNVIVRLKNTNQLCSLTTNNSSAYVNKADTPDTYEVFVSTLLTAKTTNSDVQIYTEIGPEGCRIGRVDLR